MDRTIHDWSNAVKLTTSEKSEAVELAIQGARKSRAAHHVIWGDTLIFAKYEGDGRVEVYETEIRRCIIVE